MIGNVPDTVNAQQVVAVIVTTQVTAKKYKSVALTSVVFLLKLVPQLVTLSLFPMALWSRPSLSPHNSAILPSIFPGCPQPTLLPPLPGLGFPHLSPGLCQM